MNFWKRIQGMVQLHLTGADPAGSLAALTARDIPLEQVVWLDPLTVGFCCPAEYRKQVHQTARRRGDSLKIIRRTGLGAMGSQMLGRPMLVLGCLLFLVLTLVLPTRVLFFRVEGNVSVPSRQILEAAADCGIRFGVSRRQVRSEKMKNALLGAMPELKWAGINTLGCTATISVRERAQPEPVEEPGEFGHIAAARDAYVTSCTVTRGSALVAPGQVVRQGQILISGYTDLGLFTQVTQAQGEVFGETSREIRAVAPLEHHRRAGQEGEERFFSLILGKKRINFGKGSGISPATCGRMVTEYDLTLPGGFCLPVSLAVETVTRYDTVPSVTAPEARKEGLAAFSRQQVLQGALAGQILREESIFFPMEDCCILESRYGCSEMIGRVTKE